MQHAMVTTALTLPGFTEVLCYGTAVVVETEPVGA
jgi:hypothetical protein